MLKKFFVQIILITIVVCFFGLNFNTKVDIRFWFNDSFTLKDVSLFIALAVAYIAGLLTFLPYYFIKSIKNKKKNNIEPTNADE